MQITIQSHNIINAAKQIKLLGEMFGNDCYNPYATFEILLTAERQAHKKALDHCNGYLDGYKYEAWKDRFVKKLAAKLGLDKMPEGFFVNSDPRGYSLKMQAGTFPDGLIADWGGYGILAPDFS